jgi:hypothetical protein
VNTLRKALLERSTRQLLKLLERLSRSPPWVWVALDPLSKLLLAIEVGERSLAMAQRLVHHAVQVLAPGCIPLFLTDGFKEYATASLTHFGYWMQPPRQILTGPSPKPHWMPRPELLYAQVVKTYRRRRGGRARIFRNWYSIGSARSKWR